MREFLSGVLGNYERSGTEERDPDHLGNILTIRYGGILDARRKLGSVAGIRQAFVDVQGQLYRA